MNKQDFELKVQDINTPGLCDDLGCDQEIIDEASQDYDIAISVFDNDGYLYDSNFRSKFDELFEIDGLREESSGVMYYKGTLSIDQLVNLLTGMGFNAR